MNEIRDRIIPIRVSYSELKKITTNANKATRGVSTYMREVALGIVVKEKPDDRFYECLKNLRYIRAGLKNIANVAHFTKRIDTLQYDKEIEKIDNFILEIKRKYLE